MSELNNDWDYLLKKKEENNRLLDQQLLRKSIDDKKSYKQDLDFQQTIRSQDKVIEKEQKKSELLNINLKNKLIQSEEHKKHFEKLELQKFLANQYEFQSNYLKNKQKLDQLTRIEEDRRKMVQVESQILRDAQSKKEEKLRLMRQNDQMLRMKEYERSQRELSIAKEKQAEVELLNRRAEQDLKRERNYKEFYRKIENHQDYLQNLYLSRVSPQLSEKHKQVDSWVNKNVEAQLRALRAKEAYEEKIKQETVKNMKQVWRYQIDEKNERLSKIKEEQNSVYAAIQNQVNESKRLEMVREVEKKGSDSSNKDFLYNRSGSGRRNSGIFMENPVGQFHGRSSSVAPNPVMYPSSPKESRISNGSFNSYHNPITNPIGDSPPRPIQRPFYKPHTLIAI